ncbi:MULTISPECIES: hypothetical protein [Salmonella]|uniref:Uncharacterized protein n=1 Tax=Salmonella gallinarum TaxID=594 RepID=A0A752IL28_SALGL|nr:hypothetical protein [Salmonella enterica]HAF7491338.1 hypothetical protein [Salmonella enterica subsp. enterica serovar Gallinarum]AZV12430.1 hypothetical protein EK422_23570 [Salmonella enterica subsp. enterica serovar Braenderup str. ATCC BAA-664]EAW7897857.1 hypothetical protein [Salmonella enterica]EAY4693938.1 hypothetical protein [Salmonella enterica]EBA2414731.1 hypothetical protein [Salmonella enterica]
MSNLKVLSHDSVKQVIQNSNSTSSKHPGIGGSEYLSVFEDKVYSGQTQFDIFNNNNLTEIDSVIDLLKDESLKQAGGKKYNSANAQTILNKGESLEQYIKVILYFPPNLTPKEQIEYRDVFAEATHNLNMPTFYTNKANKSGKLVARNFQGQVPLIKGQIHVNQSNQPHCEINIHNRAYKNITRNANGKIISAETSPILDLSDSDTLEKFIDYVEGELAKKGFDQKLTINHQLVKTNLKASPTVTTAASNLVSNVSTQTAPTTPTASTQPEPAIVATEQVKGEPETKKSSGLQEALNNQLKEQLIEEGIDKSSLEDTLRAISSSIDTGLNIQSESGGFKDENHVSITLEKSKNSTYREISELLKAVEAKKKEYEILEITQNILEQNKVLTSQAHELKEEIEIGKDENKKLADKVKVTVSKNLELSIDLDTAKETNDYLLTQRINREKEFDKKLSSKEKLLKAYKEKIKSGFSRLNAENSILLKNNNSLKTENESLLSEVASYAEQNEALSNEIKAIKEASEKEIKSLKEKNETLTNEVKEIKEIKNELKEASKLNRDSLLKINDLLQTIADKDTKFNETLKTEVDAVKAQEAQKLDSFKKANKKQNDQIAEQIKSLQSNYKAELTEKDEIIQKLKEELEQFKNPKPKTPKA